MQIINVRTRSNTEIVFASIQDMITFCDELENGKRVVIAFTTENPDTKRGEIVLPSEFPLINDGKIKLRSEETTTTQ